MSDKRAPLGIKVISIVYFICALFLLVFSIMLFFSFDTLKEKISLFPFLEGSLNGNNFGIIILIIALLFVAVGVWLWRRAQWARISSLVFTVIGIIGSITNIAGGRWLSIINLALYLLIGIYLIFSKKVKEAFAYP